MNTSKVLGIVAGSLWAVATAADVAAMPKTEKCERVISRAAGKYVAQRTGVLRRCEKLLLQGILPAGTDCAKEPPMTDELRGLTKDLQDAIGKGCGGADQTCGTDDDMALADVGWGDVTQCPDLDGAGCTGPIASCADVATCVGCVGDAASSQAVGLAAGELDATAFGSDSQVNACQLAIVKASSKFLQISTRVLTKCWVGVLRGKQEGDCPGVEGKADDVIAKAEAKKRRVICKACGGADAACGGSDDLTVDAIGFVAQCPNLTVPSGAQCGAPVTDLSSLVDCVDCVASFKAECVARLAMPGAGPYPAECKGAGSPTIPPAGCGNGVVDPGEECDASSPGGAFSCPAGTTCTSSCTCAPGSMTCGNGVVDPGEPCDPSSPGGAFACPAGTTCTAACTCPGSSTTVCDTTTTTTTCHDMSTTTTTTTTPTTSSTVPSGTCGNGVLDPGEQCDMSSPAGSFVCPPGCACDPNSCTCVPSGSTTTTTIAPGCGNGVLDPGEECDPSSPAGSFTCPEGAQCTVGCTCGGSTTSTTAAPGSTTTTTGATSTSTTQPTGSASFLDFTTSASLDDCGTTFADTAGEDDLTDLTCGGLNIGGGLSTVLEGPTPDGSTSRFTLSCNGNACTLGATTAPGATFDCTGTGCNFGTPLPIPNGGISTCVANSFAAPASGTVDLGTGAMSASVSLASRVVLTGNAQQPCPICRSGSISGAACAGTPDSPCTGVCQGSPNQGDACTSTNSDGLSRDCPQPAAVAGSNRCYGGTNNGAVCSTSGDCGGGICSLLVGTIPVNLSPLTTATVSKTAGNGLFCTSQAQPGCFGDGDCKRIDENGTVAGSLLPVGTSHDVTLASVFCIPASGSILIDASASLPGPGATSLPGTLKLVP